MPVQGGSLTSCATGKLFSPSLLSAPFTGGRNNGSSLGQFLTGRKPQVSLNTKQRFQEADVFVLVFYYQQRDVLVVMGQALGGAAH